MLVEAIQPMAVADGLEVFELVLGLVWQLAVDVAAAVSVSVCRT